VRILSGDYLTATTTQDRALNGIPSQRVNQVLANVYGDKTSRNFLNRGAFALPAMGTFPNQGIRVTSARDPRIMQFALKYLF
jgi:hypothetical protein